MREQLIASASSCNKRPGLDDAYVEDHSDAFAELTLPI